MDFAATEHGTCTRAKVRAWFAVFCVALLMLSTILHASQHVESVANSAVAELSLGGSGGDAPVPEKPMQLAEHCCCGCVMSAILPVAWTGSSWALPTAISFGAPPRLAGHSSRHELPPPKSLT